MQRRRFLSGVGALVAGSALGETWSGRRLALGYDNFAVRAMGWKDRQLIDHAAKLKLDTVFITDLDAFEELGDDYLEGVREHAADRGIRIYLGTWSICPSSVTFRNTWGTADEHLRLGLRAAKALGSPVLRVILGKREDRLTEGGIEARIVDTVKVLKGARGLCEELGVKVAVENHAGDMHSRELVSLVEQAGPEYVGVNLDSGNAVWTLETPLSSLENLGKYTLTTSLRDSQVWPSENGVTAQWTAMGEGLVDWTAYFRRFAELCPEAPVQIETISGFQRELALDDEAYWEAWPQGRPASLGKFRRWAASGRPIQPDRSSSLEQRQAYQLGEIERSIAFCKSIGLGTRDGSRGGA